MLGEKKKPRRPKTVDWRAMQLYFFLRETKCELPAIAASAATTTTTITAIPAVASTTASAAT
jgi:hypothetical protein